jgi:hypothetical protein
LKHGRTPKEYKTSAMRNDSMIDGSKQPTINDSTDIPEAGDDVSCSDGKACNIKAF